MSEPGEAAVKRWTVEEWHEFPEWGEILTWPSDPPLRALVAEVDDEDDAGAIAAYAALVQAVRDAERLRNLVARFEAAARVDLWEGFRSPARAVLADPLVNGWRRDSETLAEVRRLLEAKGGAIAIGDRKIRDLLAPS